MHFVLNFYFWVIIEFTPSFIDVSFYTTISVNKVDLYIVFNFVCAQWCSLNAFKQAHYICINLSTSYLDF